MGAKFEFEAPAPDGAVANDLVCIEPNQRAIRRKFGVTSKKTLTLDRTEARTDGSTLCMSFLLP